MLLPQYCFAEGDKKIREVNRAHLIFSAFNLELMEAVIKCMRLSYLTAIPEYSYLIV